MATLEDLRTAVHDAVRAAEAKLGPSRARELDFVTTGDAFDAAIATNDTTAAITAARRIAEKAAEFSAKDAAAEVTNALDRLDSNV